MLRETRFSKFSDETSLAVAESDAADSFLDVFNCLIIHPIVNNRRDIH